MISTIITCAVTFCTSTVLGFLLGKIKNYKKQIDTKNEIFTHQSEALKCLLRSGITSKYYVYSELGHVPRYEKENMNYMHNQYKSMGGNSYVDLIMDEFNKLPIKED